jgi:hypothetical protein
MSAKKVIDASGLYRWGTKKTGEGSFPHPVSNFLFPHTDFADYTDKN